MLIPGRDKLGASHRGSTLGMKPPLTPTGYVHPLKDAAIGLCDPMTAACQASLSITNSQSLLKLMSIELVMPSNHLILCHPFLFLPSIFPRIRVFSNESVLHIMWPKYWSFSFSISPSSVYIQDWFPLGLTCLTSLLSQGLLRVFSNTTVQKHQLFGAQPFYGSSLISIYDPGKTVALTIWAFVGKVMSLLFNMLSRLVKALLPRSKHLLISWLQSHL